MQNKTENQLQNVIMTKKEVYTILEKQPWNIALNSVSLWGAEWSSNNQQLSHSPSAAVTLHTAVFFTESQGHHLKTQFREGLVKTDLGWGHWIQGEKREI